MSLRFELAYLFGYTPWDRGEKAPPERLRELIEGPAAVPRGRALDLGCGMGLVTVYLARHGFKATGVDMVERALGVARRRAATHRVEVELVQGDVTRLDQAGVTGPFDLLIDRGCFHNLSEDERARYNASITRVAAAGAELILFSLGRCRNWLLPAGAEREDVERCFSPGWRIAWSAPEERVWFWLPAGVSATWYRLQRKG
jgi:cyclopropane fatty-acyl-phospholipid synthase-like methyltransferase